MSPGMHPFQRLGARAALGLALLAGACTVTGSIGLATNGVPGDVRQDNNHADGSGEADGAVGPSDSFVGDVGGDVGGDIGGDIGGDPGGGDTAGNNPCLPDPCNGRGTCASGTGGYECSCSSHFSGRTCSTCSPAYTGPTCSTCATGYYPFPIGSVTCIHNPCLPDPCNGHGTCTNDTGAFVCSCNGGYGGPTCSSTGGMTVLTVEGQTFTNTYTAAHAVPTLFTFRNNSITEDLTEPYFLNAGDESAVSTNNNLDAAVITGNRIVGVGSAPDSLTHAVMTGYNVDDSIKYNYILNSAYGIVTKSGNAGTSMEWTSGGIAYNIFKDCVIGVIVRGISGIAIYNNVFYQSFQPYPVSFGGLVYVQENESAAFAPSTGTKVFNNIFYTKYQVTNIYVEDTSCAAGFESDYNLFYCESGEPVFAYGASVLTLAQWRALGYDTHSVVVDPNFTDTTAFVPSARLDHGTDLGPTWQAGLSIDATWGTTAPETTDQNGTWQVGARVY